MDQNTGGAQGGGTTPPWLTDAGAAPMGGGSGSSGDDGTTPAGTQAGFDPFADPFAATPAPAPTDSPASTSADPAWMTPTSEEQPAPTAESSFDPFADPFNSSESTDEKEEVYTSAMSIEQSDPRTSGAGALDLLEQLKAQLLQEDEDFAEQIQAHEDSIHAEQASIRELKQERREKLATMQGIMKELASIIPVSGGGTEHAAHKATHSKKRTTHTKSAKKIDNGLLTSA